VTSSFDGEEAGKTTRAARGASVHETALAMLGRRALSVHEVRERLARKGFGETAIRGEIARLRAVGLLDDDELARAVCRSQLRQGRGRRAIIAALRRRGLRGAVLEGALAAMSEEDESDALAAALARAARKYPNFTRLPRVRLKVIRYLLSRGFGMAAVRRAAAAFGEEGHDEEETLDEGGSPDVP
jgi:regulatory protein